MKSFAHVGDKINNQLRSRFRILMHVQKGIDPLSYFLRKIRRKKIKKKNTGGEIASFRH